MQGGSQPLRLTEQFFRGPRVRFRQYQKLGASFSGDDAAGLQKVDQALPRQFAMFRDGVNKVDGEASSDEANRRWERNPGAYLHNR